MALISHLFYFQIPFPSLPPKHLNSNSCGTLLTMKPWTNKLLALSVTQYLHLQRKDSLRTLLNVEELKSPSAF